MSSKTSRPPLTSPDLGGATVVELTRPPITKNDDGRYEAASRLETHEAVAARTASGAVTTLNPNTMPRGAGEGASAPVEARRRSPELSLSIKVPASVMKQLKRRYAETDVTIRNQVLLALKKDGLEVDDNEIVDERKRPRG